MAPYLYILPLKEAFDKLYSSYKLLTPALSQGLHSFPLKKKRRDPGNEVASIPYTCQ